MRPRKTLVAAFAVVAVLAFVLALRGTEFGQILEYRTLDHRFRLRPAGEIDPRILVIAIDDQSIEVAGRWPWPRDFHATLLQAMESNRPAAVGFDILFVEPDTAHPEGDRALAEQADMLGCVVFGAVLKEGGQMLLPFPSLRATNHWGLINAERDSDGVLRHVPLWIEVNGQSHPSLISQTLATVAAGVDRGNTHAEPEPRSPIAAATSRIPINFRAAPRDFLRATNAVNFLTILKSYGQVLEGQTPDFDLARLRDRIILVGLSATGIDVAPTPIDDNMPLVFAQANAIHNILQQDFLRRAPTIPFWIVMGALFFGLAQFNIRHRALSSVLVSVTVIALYMLLAFALFRWASVWIEGFWPVIGLALVFSSVTAYQFFTEEREKRFVKNAFQKYLSPNVMAEVLENPHKLVLGGVRRKMTVLFSDIRGFTSYAEKRPPEEVVPVLNELQDELTKVIFRHDGTLNKFMGDGLMAFWGAPGEPRPDDAERAVRAAQEMVETVKRLEAKWRAQGIEPFGIGVGINTGEMIVGNMGSTMHFDYTAIGDEVNLGARLEALTRQYDASILVSETTNREVRDKVQTRELGEVTVKGRAQPVRVFAVDGIR